MSTHLLFSHIPKNTSSLDLRRFAEFDDAVVTSSQVRVNSVTGRGYGVGFVTYASVDDAARAAELLQGKQLQGTAPRVSVPTAAEAATFGV